jgi:small subunit ribosomal protein S3Ae
MAKKDNKKTSKIKVKKKLWCKVVAPKIFGNREVGESYLTSPESAVGRKLSVNLRDLTNNVKDQNVHIVLQVNKVNGTILNTSTFGYKLTPAYIKRLVRKNTARLDDYFVFKTKGGKDIILKSLMVSFGKCQRSTKSALRKELQNLLEEEVKKSSFDFLVSNLINFRIQSTIKKKLNKIFPLKEVAIRVLTLKEKGLIKEEIIVDDRSEEKTVEKASPVKEEAKEEKKAEVKEEAPAEEKTEEIEQKEEPTPESAPESEKEVKVEEKEVSENKEVKDETSSETDSEQTKED